MINNNEEEEVRIGVFVCHCGSNIGGLIDCKKLSDYAKTLPNVAYSEDNLYTCSENGLNNIKKAIKEHNLNRVVVASCTPRTHEPLFRETIQEAGLNQYLFNFVNIRDQCTWVHMANPEEAYQKAEDLIRMGVAKAAKLKPLEDIFVKITPSALVIGGGVAGISAALNLSKQGYKTYLVEKSEQLGGKLNDLFKLFPTDENSSEFLKKLIGKLESSNNIEIFRSSIINNISGFVGNYDVQIATDDSIVNIKVGVIIVAVGASTYKPLNLFGYDGVKIITQLELEKKLKNNSINAKNIVMIQCVGTRNNERAYCSSICCMTALKNALLLKEMSEDIRIIILFRDIYTPGIENEKYYRKAREKGIIFIKYSPERQPIVNSDNVKVFNEYLGTEVEIPYDLVVLSTPLIANEDNKNLAQMLKVPLEENGFFLEAHVKLRPVDFATDGIFLAGTAKWPVNIAESISQGYAAAARASTILAHDTLKIEGITASLPEFRREMCTGCNICVRICPFNAIIKDERGYAYIQEALCKGCGVCGASCPERAIIIKHFTNEQILSEIYALGGRF
ncbi:MAG: CoB--CoM heterodisulfide reductase iron-sulfur subunit A family protein [Promethearchaeota archaeon]